VDLGGRAVVPGLVDAHCHLVSYGMNCRREADLRGVRSVAEIQARLRRHMATHGVAPGSGAWLLGRGFDQELLSDGRWPARRDLEAVSDAVPVRITRVCGHALVANAAAMRMAGVPLAAGAPPTGGPDDPDAGIFTEDAMAPFHRAVPAPTAADWLDAAAWATGAAAAAGFTGVHCLIAHRAELNALVRLRAEGRLPIRIRLQLPYSLFDAARSLGVESNFGDEWLRMGAVKLFADGSLGARTAALRDDYADEPGNRGQLLFGQEELDGRVQAIADAGFQVAVHAIGDAALESVLHSFERCRGLRLPPRVEHASLCPPDLMARMKSLGVVAAVQPQFVLSDFWTEERLGPARARWAYPFRSMLEAGIPLAGSTDCPVEALSALEAWQRAVTRDGRSPAENLSPEAALQLFSEGAAHACGEESGAGRLSTGCRADFVVLEGGEPAAIGAGTVRVAATVVGGRFAGPQRVLAQS
jgi:predicted amidohydrolase YtcJ